LGHSLFFLLIIYQILLLLAFWYNLCNLPDKTCAELPAEFARASLPTILSLKIETGFQGSN